MTIFDFYKRFPTEKSAIDFIIKVKYNGTYVCPFCGCVHNIYRDSANNGKDLYCNNCKSHFSVLKGTIFENTHLDIRMWLYAMNLVMVAKKGISACQLQRELGMKSYKDDGKHTNGIESFWAIVKRGVYGIYHHVSVRYMQTYMDEFCFRMNHRKVEDGFNNLLKLSLVA